MNLIRSIISFFKAYRIVFALLGLTSLALAVLVRAFLTEIPISWRLLLALGSCLLVIFFLSSMALIWSFTVSKHGRYSLNTLFMVLIFLGIVAMANWLGLTFHQRLDTTQTGRFTLAPQTVKLLEELNAPVAAHAFFPDLPEYEAGRQAAEDLLKEYRYHARNFQFTFADPETDPEKARSLGVRHNGEIVFSAGQRRRGVRSITEQAFTSAIMEVAGIESKAVYFLSGHGERDINNTRADGYSLVRLGLIRDLYRVDSLNLSLSRRVPGDCAALIIAGPRSEATAAEMEALEDFIQNNGKLLLMADPETPAGFRSLLAPYGVLAGPGEIEDTSAYARPDTKAPAVFRGGYPPVIVTSGLDTTYFPGSSPIVLTPEMKLIGQKVKGEDGRKDEFSWPVNVIQEDSIAILPLALTTTAARLEPGQVQGPFALGAMLIASAPIGRAPASSRDPNALFKAIIIGDADFAANQNVTNGGNGDLILNAVGWLAEQEHLISIRPKQQPFRRLLVGPAAASFIRFSAAALVPLLVLLLGLAIWTRSRSLRGSAKR